MNLAVVSSKNNVPIRLTQERWLHITTSHKEIDSSQATRVLDAIEKPDAILKGDTGELLAIKRNPRKEAWIVVAYKEVSKDDGFVLTAYVTTDNHWLFQKECLWNKEQ